MREQSIGEDFERISHTQVNVGKYNASLFKRIEVTIMMPTALVTGAFQGIGLATADLPEYGEEARPKSPREGADTSVWLATLPDDGPTAGFFTDRSPIDW